MTTELMPEARQRYYNNDGTLAAGCKLYTYAAGTSTPKDTYTDAAGTVPHQNPITLDAKGEAVIYWDGAYKVDLLTAAGAQITGYPVDNFNTDPSGANTLESRLFSNLGAGMVGFSNAVVYAAMSVGRLLQNLIGQNGGSYMGYISDAVGAVLRNIESRLRDMAHIKDFGAVCDGVADDGPAWALATASGKRTIDARGMTMLIMTQVNLASNQTLLLAGAKILTGGTALKTFSAVTLTKFNMAGPFEIFGDLVTNPGLLVTSCGIYVEDCTRWRIDSPTVTNIKGYGIRLEPGASAAARGDHGVVLNPRLDSCVWNWHDTAGSGAEYCTVVNVHSTGSAEAGVESAAGNIVWLGGHIVDNLKDGFRLGNGANNAHGVVSGLNVNHNAQYNLVATQVLNGQTFADCHFYSSNIAGGGAIFLDRCKGIYIDGGHWDCWLYNDKDGSSGQNIIRNMYCPGLDGYSRVLGGPNPGTDQLYVSECYGPGAYLTAVPTNDPSPVYLLAETVTPQALVSTVSTALQFAVEVFDRRNAFDPATGIFTVPIGQTGLYKIAFHLAFTGTAMSSTASYMELKKGGVPRYLFSPKIFGTTKLEIADSVELMLTAGDTLTLAASITGTAPAFGDAAYYSYVSFSRIA